MQIPVLFDVFILIILNSCTLYEYFLKICNECQFIDLECFFMVNIFLFKIGAFEFFLRLIYNKKNKKFIISRVSLEMIPLTKGIRQFIALF